MNSDGTSAPQSLRYRGYHPPEEAFPLSLCCCEGRMPPDPRPRTGRESARAIAADVEEGMAVPDCGMASGASEFNAGHAHNPAICRDYLMNNIS